MQTICVHGILYEMKVFVFWILGSTMGDYMRPKTAPGNEGGSTLFTLRWNRVFFIT